MNIEIGPQFVSRIPHRTLAGDDEIAYLFRQLGIHGPCPYCQQQPGAAGVSYWLGQELGLRHEWCCRRLAAAWLSLCQKYRLADNCDCEGCQGWDGFPPLIPPAATPHPRQD